MGFRDMAGKQIRGYTRALREDGEDAESYLRRIAESPRPPLLERTLVRQAGDLRTALQEYFAFH